MVAGLRRDKPDLQQSLDAPKVEMQRNPRQLPKFGSPLNPNDAHTGPISHVTTEDDPFTPSLLPGTGNNHGTSVLFPVDELGFLDTSPDPSALFARICHHPRAKHDPRISGHLHHSFSLHQHRHSLRLGDPRPFR